jgi:CBS domain-containing protein
MTQVVITTGPDASLDQAARLLREFHVSGLPVVDSSEQVIGVVSEKDLIRDLHQAAGVGSPRGLLDLLLESAPAKKGESILEVCRNRLRHTRVREVMSQPVVSVGPEASLIEAARLMKRNGVNRLPVVDTQRHLVGIVARCDIVDDLSSHPSRVRGSLHPSRPKVRSRAKHSNPYFDI